MIVKETRSAFFNKIHVILNNRTFTYAYIYPALAMMSVLWVSDRALSIAVLILFVGYSIAAITKEFSIHISAKVFCAIAVLFLLMFEFLIVPDGPVKVAIYSFTALSILEILVLKVVRGRGSRNTLPD